MRERLLTQIARLALARPYPILSIGALLALVSLALLPRLEVTASRFALIAHPAGDARDRTEAFTRDFGQRADLVVEVRGPTEPARAAADELAARLGELEEAQAVLHRVEPSPTAALLSLPLRDLEALAALPAGGPPPRIASIVEQARRGLAGETGETLDDLDDAPAPTEGALRMLTRLLVELGRWLGDPDREALALVDPPSADMPVDGAGYLASRDHRTRYVFLTPREATDRYAYVAPLTREVRAIGEELAAAHEVGVAVTGYPAIAADEIDAIRNGSFVTGLVAAILVMLLFALGFRSQGGIVVAGLPLGLGILWAFGAVALTVGELNLLTQVAAPVFAGLGIDFAIHLLAAYDEARREGAGHEDATERSLRRAGKGILTGGLTTAGAFASLMLAEYEAFAQLGLVASLGLLLVMAAVLLLTPALLTVGERRGWAWLKVGGKARPLTWATRVAERFSTVATARPRRGLALGVALTLGLGLLARPLVFDADVEALMPQDAESIVAGRRMVEMSAFSNEHLGVRAADAEEARRLSRRLAALPSVGRVESASLLWPDDLEAKLALLRETRAHPRTSASIEGVELTEALGGLAIEARGAARELRATSAAAAEPLAALAEAAEAAQRRARRAEPERVAAFDGALASGAARWREALRTDPRAPGPDDLPPALRERLVADDGSFALYAFPDGDVFAQLDTFNAEVRSVAPGAVGYPIQYAAFLDRMTASLMRASVVAFGLVLVILWLDFRRLSDALLSLLPVALGVGWLYGLMSALSLDVNLANVAALPLILGIGVDDGVHFIHRVRELGDARRALTSIWPALVLTTATTIAGFGTIGLAPHRGMQSFALVMVLGSACCLLATLVVLPAILTLLQARRDKSSTRPTTGTH